CRSSTAWRSSPTAPATVCDGTKRPSPNSSSIENMMGADGPLIMPELQKSLSVRRRTAVFNSDNPSGANVEWEGHGWPLLFFGDRLFWRPTRRGLPRPVHADPERQSWVRPP